ncbi:MAG: YhbY family RNA-binding protein [Proteobacteria bacterium]|nr:YhbY family RNA-binding protein [Pseudomonadota bacterium]
MIGGFALTIPLTGAQKQYLRGVAHPLKPVVIIGQKGIVDSVIAAVEEALKAHELIKIKFRDIKEKEEKKVLLTGLEEKTGCRLCGLTGHVAIVFRQNKDPKKRKINLHSI